MLDPIRKLAFHAYLRMVDPLPLPRGKVQIARILRGVLGRAVYDVGGVKLELDPVSQMDRAIVSGKGHDPLVASLIEERLRGGGVFIDVGANMGYFSLLAARIPNVEVLAFEPSPREQRRFHRNMELNQLPGKITLFPYGLSDCVRHLPLHISSDANPGMNSVADLQDIIRCTDTVSIVTKPLDCFITEDQLSAVKLCKIDVEGYELFVLAGFAGCMAALSDAAFIVEISASFLAKLAQSPQDIYDFFQRFGFVPRFGPQDKYQYDEVFIKQA